MLPACEGGVGPRSLRGPLLAWLAPAHDAVHGRARLSCQAVGSVAPGRWQQTERKESGAARRLTTRHLRPPSVPEIRYMIARLLLPPIARPTFVRAWSWWRRYHQAPAANAHYRSQMMQL